MFYSLLLGTMNNRRLLALGALLSIVLAIVLFINPVEGALSIILYLGILLLVSGILLVVS
ncbi:MAG: hypothetical protein H6766_03150 [Candidatus Peribacteria bacterium]|nr:MAG: hypothetical protein H6766_03150 [Candidatus Peribacteria bacterium]